MNLLWKNVKFIVVFEQEMLRRVLPLLLGFNTLNILSSNESGVSNSSILNLWIDIIKIQEVDQLVWITSFSHYFDSNVDSIYTTQILIDPGAFEDTCMLQIHKSMVAANRNPNYIIDDTTMNRDEIAKTVKLIRKYDDIGFIFIYTNLKISAFLSNTVIVTASKKKAFQFDLFVTRSFCRDRNCIEYLNSWSDEKGFKYGLYLPPSFRGSFYNTDLVISCVPTAGAFLIVGKDQKGKLL